MRLAGLLVLAIFFPVLAHAAPPSLTTYTLSQDTIYPEASNDSGLATTTAIDTAFSEQVKVSIKIVSADGSVIKSLYSSSGVTNPTPKIWDGTNTAGSLAGTGTYTVLISATSTATSIAMTDSSKTIIVASLGGSDSSDSDSDTPAITTAAAGGAPPEYIPIPTLRIITGGNKTVSSDADTPFIAVVYDDRGNKRDDAVVMWSFGDGMRRTGASVFHTYYEPGEYLAVVRATTAVGGNTQKEMVVTVKDASIKITSVSARGITLANNDSRTLDLSLWRLSMGGKEFRIPEDTHILAGHTVLLSSKVTGLPLADSAFLLYPDGEVAAMYPTSSVQTATAVQPSPSSASYKKVSEVEPITSARTEAFIHEETVGAPAAAIELAAAGAALSPAQSESATRTASRIFKSPWTLGFLGVLALAGSALIFL